MIRINVSVCCLIFVFSRINDQLRSTVSAVVHEELVKDGQAQHFTRRAQKAALAKSTVPLAQKIESKVEEKLAEMKKEIEELRTVKLASPPKPIVLEDEEDEEEEEEEVRRHRSGSEESWFRKNELGGGKNSPKVTGKQHSHGHGHGHSQTPLSKLENDLDLDFGAISQDIKKSVEYVMKKHMNGYPSPRSPTNRARGASRDEAELAGVSGGAGSTVLFAPQPQLVPVAEVDSPRMAEEVSAPEPVAGTEKPHKHHHKGKKTKPKASAAAPALAPEVAVATAPALAPSVTAPAPAPEQHVTHAEPKKGVMSSFSSLFGGKGTSAPAAVGTSAAFDPAYKPSAISDGEERQRLHQDEEEGQEEEDDNSVTRMLREREQWERDITQAEEEYDFAATALNTLTSNKVTV